MQLASYSIIAVFCPKAVFQSLYHGSCYTAHCQVYSTDALSSYQCNRVEKHFVDLFMRMEKGSEISSQVHCHNIKQQNQFWTGVHSNSTCFTCLWCSPEHPLPCGHSICDICAEIFGEAKPHAEYEYAISQCVPCGKSVSLDVWLKPPTAAPRLLSIDDGGSRDIIPLENLRYYRAFLLWYSTSWHVWSFSWHQFWRIDCDGILHSSDEDLALQRTLQNSLQNNIFY